MSIEIKEAGIEHSNVLARLFSEHVGEQCLMDPTQLRQPSFNARDFIEAMLNPKLNQFYAAWDGARMVGFARLAILYGDQLVPLDVEVDRMRGSYIRRLPTALLRRLQSLTNELIARVEKRNTAFSMLQPQQTGYIADLYVSADYRRKGIGSKLVEESFKWFRAMGVEAVELNVLGANEAGRAFWKSFGFRDRRILARKEIGR